MEGADPTGLGNGERLLAECDDLVLVCPSARNNWSYGYRPSRALLITQGRGQGFGLAQVIEEPPEFPKWIE